MKADASHNHAAPIVILSPSEWSDNAVSNMQIAATLSETRRVAYIETPGGRLPRWNEAGRVLRRLWRIVRGRRAGAGARGLDPHEARILTPFAIPIHGNAFIDGFNTALLLFQIRRFLHQLGIVQPVVWAFSPNWEGVALRLAASQRVFHCVDGLHTYDPSPAFRVKLERLARQADVVFTPGEILFEELRDFNANTFRIGHGVATSHLDHTDDSERLAELADVPEPRVVYAGSLANWVDYDLLQYVAGTLTDVSFVLIGDVHALAPRRKVSTLFALPNVHPVGYQDYARLPAFYRRAAAAIVPYKADNEHIRYSTPTKFMDYFAASLPVVSTRFPAAEEMATLALIADSHEDFAEALRTAIDDDTTDAKTARRAFAVANTWEAQVERMMAVLDAVACQGRKQ